MSGSRAPARTLRRRFVLGSGPLKRTSDRVEFLSRLVLLLALLTAVPAGLVVGGTAAADLRAVAEEQAATRQQASATLLSDAPEHSGSYPRKVPAAAVWTGPDGGSRTGDVDAPAGARAGSPVAIWVDPDGRVTEAPLTDSEITGQGVVLGALTTIGVIIAGLSSHLFVLWQLERHRFRRWEAGWAAVEPLWASRFR
ncbi:Rv1733c family protein [Geodermatophilus sp. URMC 64]